MLRVLGVVVGIALVDSLNPSTVAPALYLASGDRGRLRLLEFMLAVFVVHLAGGVVIALGPGQLLLSLFPAVPHIARDVVALVFGIGMVAVAVAVWRRRARLARKEVPDPDPKRKSSLTLGAGIIAVELPTAFPYFAAIAAILGSGGAVAGQVVVLVLYNVCFVLPLVAILATLLFGGQKADGILERGREFLEQRWPIVLFGCSWSAARPRAFSEPSAWRPADEPRPD